MIRLISTTALLSTCATAALAGGIERTALSTSILFAEGDRMELSFATVQPDVSGEQQVTLNATSVAGSDSGDVAGDYTTLSFGYKNQLTDRLSLALVLDQPYGADVDYSDTPYVYSGGLTTLGSTATIDATRLVLLMGYELDNNITVYGGPVVQQIEGKVDLFSSYSLTTEKETDLGYAFGVAWERPEIAARVALTYQSEITHDFRATEAVPLGPIPATETEFTSVIPQSVTLEFQSGVAADTLVFGSVKWTEWSAFDISPTVFGQTAGGSSLVDYDDDVFTYNIGVGRRFNDEWSGAITASYEAAGGDFVGNLGPTDGQTSLGVAVTRDFGAADITFGARYIWIGDAETQPPAAFGFPDGTTLGDFDDNNGIAAGIRIGWDF